MTGKESSSRNEGSYSLRWNSFQAHLTQGMRKLLEEEDFKDVTLGCDGQKIKAHKLILSICSPYFKKLFQVKNFAIGYTLWLMPSYDIQFMLLRLILH